MDAFDRLTFDDLVAYHRQTHTPSNALLVVAGAVDPSDAVRAAMRAFRGFRGPLATVPVLADAPIPAAPIRVMRDMDVESASMMHGWLTVREGAQDDAALDALCVVLADGDHSRVVRALQWERRLVHGIVATHESSHLGKGTFRFTAQLDAANLDAAQELIAEQIELLQRQPVTPRELHRARKQSEVAVRAMRQTAEGWASQLGEDFLATGSCDDSDAYLRRIGALTPEDLARVAETYLRSSARVVAAIMPVRRRSAAAAVIPGKGATHAIRPGHGRPLVVREMPDAEFVSVNVTLTGGLSLETESTNGIHQLLAEMMLRGTRSQSAERIAETFADGGSALSISAGLDATSLQFTALAGDVGPLARALADVITAPALADDQLDRLRPIVGDALARIDDEWHGQLIRAARRCFFRTSPYRFITLGSAENLARWTTDDLRRAHRSMLASGAVVSVSGRITLSDAENIAKTIFDDAPPLGSRTDISPAFDPPNEAGRLVVRTCDEDRRVAGIFVGFSIPPATDVASRASLAVLGALLAGYAFSGGRLYEALRGGDREDVYEVVGAELRGRLPGYFAVLAACEPARAAAVADTIRTEVGRISETLVGDDELGRARASVIAAEQDQLQTPAEYARRLGYDVWLGLGADDADRFRDEIVGVGADDVRRAARRFLAHPVGVVMTPGAGLSCWGDAANQESVPWELPAKAFAKSS
jgi:zinc protease